jgi:hypothetical protein
LLLFYWLLLHRLLLHWLLLNRLMLLHGRLLFIAPTEQTQK